MSQILGFSAEDQARQYLIKQGLRWVESNFHSKMGEIDLIMHDNDYLVFVEVRSRKSNAYGNPLETIGYYKQQKIIKTASLYLVMRKIYDKYPIRFDVISIEGKASKPQWIRNAFTA